MGFGKVEDFKDSPFFESLWILGVSTMELPRGKLTRWRIPENMPEESLSPLCFLSYRCRVSLLLSFLVLESGHGSFFCLLYCYICVNLSREYCTSTASSLKQRADTVSVLLRFLAGLLSFFSLSHRRNSGIRKVKKVLWDHSAPSLAQE